MAKERDELGPDLPYYLDELDALVKQRMIDAAKKQYQKGETNGKGGGGRGKTSPATTEKKETKVVMIKEKPPETPEHVEFRTVVSEPEIPQGMGEMFGEVNAAAMIADALLEKLVAKITEPVQQVVVDDEKVGRLEAEILNLQAMLKRRDDNLDLVNKRVDSIGKENEELRRALMAVRNRGERMTQRVETLLDPDIKRELNKLVTERPDQQHRRGGNQPGAER